MGKLRPILFNTPMVQAILEGRKTQTRRIVKGVVLEWLAPDMFTPEFVADPKNFLCPYGKAGDVLWVRESFLYVLQDHSHDLLEGRKENSQWVFKSEFHENWIKYAKEKYGYKWKPSIHMPFEACRLFLRVKSVRVERLQDITEDNAKAEGVEGRYSEVFHEMRYRDYAFSEFRADWKDPRVSFITLWESINGRESWRKNPWVWVIEFERISKEEALS